MTVFNAGLVNLITPLLKVAGEEIRLDPVSFGKILKKFGIDPGRHRNSGNGFWTVEENRLRVHALVKKYVLTLPSGLLAGSAPNHCKGHEEVSVFWRRKSDRTGQRFARLWKLVFDIFPRISSIMAFASAAVPLKLPSMVIKAFPRRTSH